MAKIDHETSQMDGNLEASIDTTNSEAIDAQKDLRNADLILGSPDESPEAAAEPTENKPEENAGSKKKRKRKRSRKWKNSEHQPQTMNQSNINIGSTESIAEVDSETSKVNINLEASIDTENCEFVNTDAQKDLPAADLILGSLDERPEAAAGPTENNTQENANSKKKRKRKRVRKKIKYEHELQTMDQSHFDVGSTESTTEVNMNGRVTKNECRAKDIEISAIKESSLSVPVQNLENPLKFSKDEEAEISASKESSIVCLNHKEAECLSNVLEQHPAITPIPSVMRKLIVLDVNGLLASIVMPAPKDYKADTHILGRAIFKRPFCDDFLKFCFQNFDVGLWSSRSKKIIDRVVDYLLGDQKDKLLFCWDMSHSTVTGYNTLENNYKPLVFKELRKIWENDDTSLPWRNGDYNESNTLLLDDSPYKALLNPLHTAIFPNSYHYKDANDNALGPGGDLRVYLEGLLSSENVQEYVKQHPLGQSAINETNPSWGFYSGVLKSVSAPLQGDSPSCSPTLS